MFLQMSENAHFTLIFEVLCYGLVLAQDIFTVGMIITLYSISEYFYMLYILCFECSYSSLKVHLQASRSLKGTE